MSFSASVKWNSDGVVDAVARYLKIKRAPRPEPVMATDKPESENPKPARRRARATSATVETPKKSTHPRTEGRAPRPRKRPAGKRSEEASAEAARKPLVPTCPDCDGVIESSWDQCPHCALFLNPGSTD